VPLERLGRPRIDVVVTLSGIFRDLLPMQDPAPGGSRPTRGQRR
jgi:hypothetical protein